MIVLDTNVLVYAVSDRHPLVAPSRRLVSEIVGGRVRGTTSADVIQEFAHVRARRRSKADAVSEARDYVSLLSPLLVTGEDDVRRALGLFERHDNLDSFDAVLAAAALRLDADALVSADRAFADVPRLNAVVPGSHAFDELLAS